jgi:hypothetical protein
MSREQRRLDRKQQARTGGGAPPSRRTPVKVAGGSRFPTVPLAIAGGILVLAGLLAYLIFQTGSGGGIDVSAADKAAADRSDSVPGTYVENQGRGHFPGNLAGHPMTPFCDGVPQSDLARARSGKSWGADLSAGAGTPAATSTPAATPTTAPTMAQGTGGNATPIARTDCYLSNPPTSGTHLNVQRNVDVGGGNVINIPPDPDVYPAGVEIPRDAIPHLLEHAGVFVGYNCKDGDSDCQAAIEKLASLVNNRIDNNDNRVAMAEDKDLPEGTIGLASWTRVMDFPATGFDANKGDIERFIGKNSCRFDPEGFCK